MSNYRHGRQPLPVEEVRGQGNRYGRSSGNGNDGASNSNNRHRVVATKSFLTDHKEDDDERARRMAYIFSRRPDDPKRKRQAMRGKSLEEAMAINLGGAPQPPKLDNDEGTTMILKYYSAFTVSIVALVYTLSHNPHALSIISLSDSFVFFYTLS